MPQINLQLFYNTAVTSRLIGDSGLSEALLLIDEPQPGPAGGQLLCAPGQPVTGTGSGAGVYDGSSPSHCNVMHGHAVGGNSLAWYGLPFDPPGNGLRTLRITNVRVATAPLAGSGLLSVQAFVSASPSASIPLTVTMTAVAFIQRGLYFSTSGKFDLDLTRCGQEEGNTSNYSVTLNEGFASAFRRRSLAVPAGNDVSPAPLPAAVPALSSSGAAETGFYDPATLGATAGLADQGTRIVIRFSGAGPGITLRAPLVAVLTSGSAATGLLRLVAAGLAGDGPFHADTGDSTTLDGAPAATLAASGYTLQAVFEVLLADPLRVESAVVPFSIQCAADSRPVPGSVTVAVSFAPFSTDSSAGRLSAIPRFVESVDPVLAFDKIGGSCSLLFPFVTNQAGLDTGIIIVNTSLDPLGSDPAAGNVRLGFYGDQSADSAAPPAQTTRPVAPGESLLFTLSSGGSHGVTPVPGFQGYVIVQARFRYCHGLAILSGPGGSSAAAYQGLIVGAADTTRNRSQNLSESLTH